MAPVPGVAVHRLNPRHRDDAVHDYVGRIESDGKMPAGERRESVLAGVG